MFYEQLLKLCDKNKIALTAFTVNYLKMSKGNIASWKNGGNPSVDILKKAADYFNVSTDYLLGRTDNPEVNR